uniref:Uncharacterized protein n=1 Tax=Oryza brachyantha TaxID=4533 RepID=J3N126_ORYBR
MLITWVKEWRTDRITLDASEDQCDIARLEDFISRSVQIMKTIEARSVTKSEALYSLGPQLENLSAVTRDHDEVIERAKTMENKLQDEIAALRVEHVSYLERIKDKAELEAESSRLMASNSVLELECSKLKKGKDAATVELVGKPSQLRSLLTSPQLPSLTLGVLAEARTWAQAVVEATEVRTKAAEKA